MILLVLVGVIAYFFIKAKRKVEEFSREAFGTSFLMEGFKNMEQEYADTPKTVAGMTSLYLPKIIKDFPDFSYDEMKPKAENAITSYLLAVNGDNRSLLQEGNAELKNKLENRLSDLDGKQLREHFENIKIHRTELTNYQKKDGRCIITFQTSIEYLHYVTNVEKAIVMGRNDRKEQSRYEADLIYIQDRSIANTDLDGTIGLNCPNCGAPLTSLGEKKCPYCGTTVLELNIHAWSFSDVREK